MYVRPEERGGGAVNYMLWKALNSLREEGFKRAYGYCAADNLPALWVHRIIGYKELDTIVMSRVLTATYRTKKGKNGTHLFRLFDLS
jgi:L-amino acid N-acyltransferase YncA